MMIFYCVRTVNFNPLDPEQLSCIERRWMGLVSLEAEQQRVLFIRRGEAFVARL